MLSTFRQLITKFNRPLYFFHQKAFSINNLHDNPGARRYAKIVGRGPSSGKGKTCGRGMKGDRARTGGGVPPRFEGGQSTLARRLPKFGMPKKNQETLDYVNIGTLVYYIQRGVLNPLQKIEIKHLLQAGIVKKVRYGVKILGKGLESLNLPLKLEVTDASASVIQKIKELGGEVSCVYRTPLTLRAHMFPNKFPLPLEQPIPPHHKMVQLDRIASRGANMVIGRKPLWRVEQEKAEKSELETLTKTSQAGQQEEFVYPAVRSPGCGANKIRTRRVKLWRKINYNLP